MGIMTTARQPKKPIDPYLDRDLKKIDVFFRELRHDKSLPVFSDFLVQCILFGIGENVNLKTMYPKPYKKVSKFLQEHEARIRALQKEK